MNVAIRDVERPVAEGERFVLLQGRCESTLKALPDNSVHAVLCDPPYGLSQEPDMAEVLTHWMKGDDYRQKGGGFMGKSWDSFVPGPAIWREVYRVLKPGGMLAAFAGTRTADLMGIAIRMAGFERRDTILHIGSEVYVCPDDVEFAWLYATGFPKEGDLGVAVDEHLGNEPREVVVDRAQGDIDGSFEETKTRVSGIGAAYKGAAEEGGAWKVGAGQERVVAKEPVSEEGKRWQGWSTVLKPANEPIILARKPLSEKNIPANVVKHGTGGLNIQAAAVGDERRVNPPSGHKGDSLAPVPSASAGAPSVEREGRWPPNVILSHTAHCQRIHVDTGDDAWSCFPGCPVAEMDSQSAKDEPRRMIRTPEGEGFVGVSRFFYCPKPGRSEKDAGIGSDAKYVQNRAGGSGIARDDRVRAYRRSGLSQEEAEKKVASEGGGRKNTHLTVKPIELMRWLVKLLCPPGGTVCDPFMGSGTTGCAAMLEGVEFVGCELEEESWQIAKERIEHWAKVAETTGSQEALFSL